MRLSPTGGNKMKHLFIIALVIISMLIGYIVGDKQEEIVDVTASAAGVQITYENGTGYWYEY